MSNPAKTCTVLAVPISTTCTGACSEANGLGMRAVQERAQVRWISDSATQAARAKR